MAHFAELDLTNTVIQVVVVANDIAVNEQAGIAFLKELFGQDTTWKQTSINTKGGLYFDPVTNEIHEDQSKAFRKNYAGIGFTYDESLDAFINPKPVVNEGSEYRLMYNPFSCLWSLKKPEPANISVRPSFGVTRV
jgi:hypothetical protein